MADVTVVIPTKDRAALLREALRSLGEQTAPVAEVIVTDDGSSDETAEVVRAFGGRLVRNPAGGWGAAGGRNAGLAEVRTGLVAFVDSDDLLLPRAVERLGEALDRAPDAPFAYGRALIARRNGRAWTPEGLIASRRRELATLPSSLFVRNSVPASGGLVRTAAAREVGGFDPSAYNEDFYFWLELALLATPSHVPEIVSVYRLHPSNSHIASADLDYERIVELGRRHPELAGSLARRLGVRLCEHAGDAVQRRDGRSLARAIRSILRLTPDPVGTLTAAFEHQRTRRAMTAVGREAWSRLPDLRAWLASYDGVGPVDGSSQRA
ncbi:MAG TPA: glycosyltransferase [Solirubrobacteraceae bacterium]|nr:glycosyltransferase [Solirubrobacteraceae bacterium]